MLFMLSVGVFYDSILKTGHSTFISYCCDKISDWREEKDFFQLTGYSPLYREVRTETQTGGWSRIHGRMLLANLLCGSCIASIYSWGAPAQGMVPPTGTEPSYTNHQSSQKSVPTLEGWHTSDLSNPSTETPSSADMKLGTGMPE